MCVDDMEKGLVYETTVKIKVRTIYSVYQMLKA